MWKRDYTCNSRNRNESTPFAKREILILMTRKEFLANSLIMSIGSPFLSSMFLNACSEKEIVFPNLNTDFKGKIIILGAGAAGLAAGFLLKALGVEFQIIEASSHYGGRMKKEVGLADFPVDLGAEWIHTNPSILKEISNKPNLVLDTMEYSPQEIKSWNNGILRKHSLARNFYSEWKFKQSTWFDFFEQNILPEISSTLVLDTPIKEIKYDSSGVKLVSEKNQVFEADKVLITASIRILQQGLLQFLPALPAAKTDALNSIFMGDGIKVFMNFKEKFYPDILVFGGLIRASLAEEKFVYDAAFGKESDQNVLGLFAINEEATVYTALQKEAAIVEKILQELDEIFDGQASTNYQGHVVQNWSKERYIQGAYSYSFQNNRKKTQEEMARPIEEKVYFSGEALSKNNPSTVHGACESGFQSVVDMLQ